ncbi:hypothetical protein A6X21_08395 [Planctopirus hydrillae]|uniref:Uncharacterized protein n=1 Tax=Planctopirus hydrillae TaxID=1841610 RepID=A0A1C3E8B1_9PLAN|nr:hypothetical protein A6X21_08395 [Planctopirus hydrillae]
MAGRSPSVWTFGILELSKQFFRGGEPFLQFREKTLPAASLQTRPKTVLYQNRHYTSVVQQPARSSLSDSLATTRIKNTSERLPIMNDGMQTAELWAESL